LGKLRLKKGDQERRLWLRKDCWWVSAEEWFNSGYSLKIKKIGFADIKCGIWKKKGGNDILSN